MTNKLLRRSKMRAEAKQKQGGFTLVELAIVLVIIGIILGAVLKGRDLMTSAKIKKFYSNFIEGWTLAVKNYQDRTGQLLGDGIANGGTATASNGVFDNIDLSTTQTVQNKLKQVGLDVPITNTPGNSGTYFITGKYDRSTVTGHLYNIHSDTENRNYNALYIRQVPTDVAIALDTIIDGTANGTSGDFRKYPDSQDWPDASQMTLVDVFYIIR